MKRKVKRYEGGGKIDDIQDYATLGARARAASPFSGPREYITESKEEEGPVSEGISAGKGARNLAVEETEKVTPTKKVTKTVVKKKPADSRYEDTGAKIGSQGGFKFESKAEPESRSRSAAEIRAGKAAAPEAPSKIPKNTFLTPERLESSRKSYYSGFESKPVRSAADIRAGRGMKAGGKTSSASSRADGIAQRGKTRGKVC